MDLAKLLDLGSLKNKTMLITGATAGIGLATTEWIAPLVKKTYVVGRRGGRLQELVEKMQGKAQMEYLAGDLTQMEFLQKMQQAGYFDVDILINNAGLAWGWDTTLEANIEHWNQMLDVNLRASFLVVKSCLPYMVKKQDGHIINITSIASHHAYERGGVYCATKHGLLAFAKALRAEMCEHNVKVTSISPGMVETEFSVVRFSGDEERAKSIYQGMTPLNGSDIARQILFSLTQPKHVNIDEIYITPTAQGFITKVHRNS